MESVVRPKLAAEARNLFAQLDQASKAPAQPKPHEEDIKRVCNSCGRETKHAAEETKCPCGRALLMCRINNFVHCECGLFSSRCAFCGTANTASKTCKYCGQRC
ncbi:hypothetical protein AAVH_13154 [Aphelenchoides avenae]|nr:hypothetical protein AAVH_14246 [Aphelenchus avenae]KAH7719393.1 hypothetical protein AAVH_13154 [Aphelenchus avenae]